MDWKGWVERTFSQQCEHLAAGTSQESRAFKQRAAQVPFHRKALAVSGIISLTAALTGCADDEPEFTAYEECKWEVEKNGLEYDCDDDDSPFYVKNGYKSKKQKIPSTSSYYQYQMSKISTSTKGGIGGGASRSFGG
ncbi:MAG: hypothetical protein H0Z34_04390 [Brevibacillus sp.]|nr:hypothetical protein [Brevibacillus sp.]